MITLIFASDPNFIIGNKGKLPWPALKGELKKFKETTFGGTLVMGRNTFLSLPNGPLPGRNNIVLTRKITLSDHWNAFKFNIKNILNDTKLEFKTDYLEVLVKERNKTLGDVYIIGGASIYKQMELCCDRMVWTKVKDEYDGDTKFRPMGVLWELVSEVDYSEYKILTFKKRS